MTTHNRRQRISEWMQTRGVQVDKLAETLALDKRIVEAIVEERYTTSPQQRQRLADALGVSVEDIAWGHAIEVDHMYGHGPQFGRSP